MKRRALEREPLSPLVHLAIAASYWLQRRYDQSILWANARRCPWMPATSSPASSSPARTGRWATSIATWPRTSRTRRWRARPADALDALQRTYDASGRAGVVKFAIDHVSQAHGSLPAMQLALLHSELGEIDAAMEQLCRAIDAREPCLVDLAVAPQWDRLRGDPRFAECLEPDGPGRRRRAIR